MVGEVWCIVFILLPWSGHRWSLALTGRTGLFFRLQVLEFKGAIHAVKVVKPLEM